MSQSLENQVDEWAKKIPPDFIGGPQTNKQQIIAQLIVDNDLRTMVEIGVWRGRTLIPMAIATGLIGGRTFGIDPYTAKNMAEEELSPQIYETLNEAIPKIDFDGVYQELQSHLSEFPNCTLIRKPAIEAADEIPSVIDGIHIDGNHDQAFVESDIKTYLPKVKPMGLIIMDDIDFPGVLASLHLFDGVATKVYDGGTWGVWQKWNNISD